ncbi:MAG: tetratricopeptide repeat protein [Bryobacteraceae bacterium]
MTATQVGATQDHTGKNALAHARACATDYEIELQRAQKDIVGLIPYDIEKATKLVYRIYHRASLIGDLAGFAAAENAIDDAIRRFGPKEDLCLLKANLDFHFHRLAQGKRDLEMAPALPSRFEGKAMLADLDFQQGRYARAKTAYQELVQENRTWDNLARLAFFQRKMGDTAGADRLYFEAEDELTAKEMRSYAWLELQRGVLDLSHGRYEDARMHYQRAAQAYSGHWLTGEHMAELLAAERKFEEAAALYERLLTRIPKPELQQTLGEVYVMMGKPEQAEPLYEKALAAYLQSAQRGEVHYYHHLSDFYTDVCPNAPEAVKWARKDIELRNNFSTQAALASALHLDGRHDEALDLIDQALSSGVQDAHIFSDAAVIYRASARTSEAGRYLELALGIHPRHDNFHVHR